MNRMIPSIPYALFSKITLYFLLLAAAIPIRAQQVAKALPTTRTVSLDLQKIAADLSSAPLEFSQDAADAPVLFDLPMPDGSERQFMVVESPIMAEDFAKKYPDIRTYAVLSSAKGETWQGRLMVSPSGIFGFILGDEGVVNIRPLDLNNPALHEVSGEADLSGFECGTKDLPEEAMPSYQGIENSTISNGGTRRTYRLAIITTGEFYAANGGTLPTALVRVTAVVNSVQAIYDRELAVRFTLLTPIIYQDPATDPFDSTGQVARTVQAANVIAMNFDTSAYDVGHVFHDSNQAPAILGGGGVALLSAVCSNMVFGNGYNKGAGWSSWTCNNCNEFIFVVSHELGHMFGMSHSFNGNGGGCSTNNHPASTAYEIGSGTTIMAYRGICGTAQNVAALSDNPVNYYFHANSLTSAVNYMNTKTCHTAAATGNTPPVASIACGNGPFTIPRSTPFTLTGSATDANNNLVKYCWEQYDEDGAGVRPTQGFIGAQAAASNIAPLFRSYPPSNSATRTFPNKDLVIANDNSSSFEPLPTVARTLNFRLFARDNNPNGGGIHCQSLALNVSAQGPLEVTLPNGGQTVAAGSMTTVNWNLNGINFLSYVNITLSVDGGKTFPYVLASNVLAVSSSQSVLIPANVPNTNKARIRVESAGNACVVFFDISDANFNITDDCIAANSSICDDAAVAYLAGHPALALGLNRSYTSSPVTAATFDISANSPTGPLAAHLSANGGSCTTTWGNNEKYETFDFEVTDAGEYTFTVSLADVAFSVFASPGYASAFPCSGTFYASNAIVPAPGNLNLFGEFTLTLSTCTKYKLVMWSVNGANVSRTIAFSGAGGVYPLNAGPGTSYSYTYVAINDATNTIEAVSPNSLFTSLPAGAYSVYGVSYKSGGATPPANQDPATWVGDYLDSLLISACIAKSSNFKPVTVLGCVTPSFNSVVVLQPTCAVGGRIVASATGGGGILEYAIMHDPVFFKYAMWNTTGNFANVQAGTYYLRARLKANPTCYADYPTTITLTNPTNCCPVYYSTDVPKTIGAGAPNTVTSTLNIPSSGAIADINLLNLGIDHTAIGDLRVKLKSPANTERIALDLICSGEDNILIDLDDESANLYNVIPCPPFGNSYRPNQAFNNFDGEGINGNWTLTIDDINPGDGGTLETWALEVCYNTTCTPPTISAVTVTQPNCSAPAGLISIIANGNGDLQYSIDNGVNWQSSNQFDALLQGSYTVKVRLQSDFACQATWASNPVAINAVPVAPTISDAVVTHPTCAIPSGTIMLYANGNGALQYSVNAGSSWQSSDTFTGLPPGFYEIRARLQSEVTCFTIYDNNPVEITAVPVAPTVSAPTLTQPTCNTPVGVIVINASGDSLLEYSINNGASWQASHTFSGLSPGSYMLRARLQQNPTCFTNYAGNPVVLNAAIGCCTVYNSTDVPKNISTSGPSTVTSTLNIPDGGSITDVNLLNLDIDHTFIHDLTVKLKSPATTERTLLNQICSSQDNILLSLDDESGSPYASIPCPPNGGSYQAFQTLSHFDGQNLNGIWTLTIDDPNSTDGGALQAWSLEVCFNASCSPPTVLAPTVTQPTCALPSGTIVVNTSGGGTKEFSVNNGANWQTSNIFAGLPSGSYTLLARLQSNPGCVGAYTGNPIVINAVPNAPVFNVLTLTQPTCAVPTGTMVVNASGSSALNYSVDNGASWNGINTIAGLVPGNYNLLVQLQSNPACSVAYFGNPVLINAVPTVPVVNAPTVTQPNCPVPSGTILMNASGDGALEYSITNGDTWQTSNTFANLPSGNFLTFVRLQENPSCSTAWAGNPVSMNPAPATPVMLPPDVTQPNCTATTGTIDIVAVNFPNFEYSIDNGNNWQPSSFFTGLAPDNYYLKVRVQSDPACFVSYPENPLAIQPAPVVPTVTAPTVTQPMCASFPSVGTIVVNATGIGTLEYSIDGGANYQLLHIFSGLAPGSYNIRVRPQGDPLCWAAYSGNPVVLNAAFPAYINQCTSGDFIQDFTFGAFSNLATGCANPGASNYSNYFDMGPNVQVGETYSVTVKVGSFEQWVGVYIDFDQNGSYMDGGEFFNLGQAPANGTVMGNISIPAGAAQGTRTMRVRCIYNSMLTAADGCGTTFDFGEVEDYNIYIFCPNNLAVNAVPILDGTYSADQEITSMGTVPGSGNVTFSVGTGAILQPNFEVHLGGVFTVLLESCFP